MIQHQNFNQNPYQQLYQPQIQQMQQQVQQLQQPQMMPINRGGRIWVQGEAGAKSYLIAPTASADLWDSEAHTIYVKSADASGMPKMMILDYTIRGEETPKEAIVEPQPTYVSIDEFNALKDELQALKEQIRHTPKQVNKNNQKRGGNL